MQTTFPRSVALLLATLTIGILGVPVAHASDPIRVSGTGTDGLNVRPSPDTSGAPLTTIPDGTVLTPTCFVYGQTVNTVPVWWRLTVDGVTGYAASAFDDTTYSSDDELTAKYGLPRCDATSGQPAASPPYPDTASAASDHTDDCGYSDGNIQSIVTDYHADGGFKIQITPTGWARAHGTSPGTVNAMWHAVQGCVPGLYGSLADSIYQQLQCHNWGSLLPGPHGWATGPTYDLESWHLALVYPGLRTYFDSHCLNNDNYGDRVVPDTAGLS